MIKKLFCGILAATLCICTGCTANKSLSNKEIDKNNASEAQNTVNSSNTQSSTSVPAKEHPKDTAPISNQTNTEATDSKGNVVNLDSETKKQLNSFFTVFSRTRVPAFEKDKLSNDELIMFGIRYNFANNRKVVEKYEKDKSMAKLSAKYVDDAVEKYFGLKLKDYSIATEDFSYSNGYYYLPYNLNVPNTFAQVNKLVNEGNEIYSAYLSLYAAPEGISINPNVNAKEIQKSGESLKLYMNMKAKIKKVNGGYILIEYLRI